MNREPISITVMYDDGSNVELGASKHLRPRSQEGGIPSNQDCHETRMWLVDLLTQYIEDMWPAEVGGPYGLLAVRLAAAKLTES